MKLFIVEFKHASIAALSVEPRDKAFGETRKAVVSAFDQEYAKALVCDEVMHHCDDEVVFESLRVLDQNDPFVEIIS